jgi:hypothetical protein
MKKHILSLGVVALVAAACHGGGDGPSVEGSYGVRLVPLTGCADVEATLRQGAIDAMNKRLDATLKRVLTDDLSACRPGGGLYGRGDYESDSGGQNSGGGSGGSGMGGGSPSPSPDGPNETTGTNNQVAGVDEADIVKNDGKFIYLLANGAFRIIEAWPPEAAREVASVPVAGEPKKLFVAGDRALVYSSPPGAPGGSGEGPGFDYAPSRECTYGYDCDFRGDGKPTDLTLYDVSDRAAPRVLRTVRTKASLVAARRIGEVVHTVLGSPGVAFQNVKEYPELTDGRCDDLFDPPRFVAAFEQLRRQNEAAIRAASLEAAAPRVDDGAGDVLASCPGFYRSSEPSEGDGFTTVLSFSIADPAAPLHASTIISRPGATYASGEALYVAVPPSRADHYYYGGGDDAERPKPVEASVVHKFVFDGGAAFYGASGEIKGRVLNQFAMDERDGFLRIATTSGHLPDPATHSTLSVAAQRGEVLEVVGQVDDIAPSEDIRSVRFDGDRGYVVTFKKTDPLFVFDLADPAAPRVLGELKIPGFSTYMHRLDEGHLLTIGYDADEMDGFAFFDGILLQVFDVRDPANPRLAHKTTIGTRGSSSEALTNHLAFTYFAQKGLLALPMSICEGGGDGSYGEFTFGGVLVYGVSAEGGFVDRGRVDFGRPPDEQLYSAGPDACSNWWTNATSAVKRTIFMDDFLYSVASGVVKVNHVSNLAADVASVDVSAAPPAAQQ